MDDLSSALHSIAWPIENRAKADPASSSPANGERARRRDTFEARSAAMNRCACCGGPLGQLPYRKLRLRFCRLACKKAYEHRQRERSRGQTASAGALARAGT